MSVQTIPFSPNAAWRPPFRTTRKRQTQFTVDTITLVDLSGLSFPIKNGTYCAFTFHIVFRSSAVSQGCRITLAFPSVNDFAATVEIPRANDGTTSSYLGQIENSNGLVISPGVPSANTDFVIRIQGIIHPSADGILQVRAANENTAGSQTLTWRPGSVGILYAFPG